jgi:hypothetical protein
MAAGKQRFPRWWQSLIIIASGIALGLSSCVGFLGTLNFGGGSNAGQALPLLLAAGFFGGIFIALAGCVLLLISVARAIVNNLATPTVDASVSFTAAMTPGAVTPAARGALAAAGSREQRALRQFQMALIVLMLLPATGIATSALILFSRPRAWPSLFLILATYVLSQGPYFLAFVRTRRGPDRLGIAIAFAASCTFFVEGLLPLFQAPRIFALAPAMGFFFWPGLFLIGHIVVAVFAWRAGRLAPPEEGDFGLIATSFAGVIVYLVVVRFLEVHFLPLLLR